MEAKQEATQKEIEAGAAFMLRMMPDLLKGVAFEDAARAVLKRDKELFQIASGETEVGAAIRSQLADSVFDKLNAQEFAERQARNAKEAVIKKNLSTAIAALAKAEAP